MTINSKMYACVLAAAALVLATAENPAFLSKHPKGRELLSSVEWTALGPMQKFSLWKDVFQPQYETDVHESAAFASFKYNDAIIEAHNDDTSSSYRLGHNEFSDLSLEEFHSRMGLKIPVTKLRSRKRNVDTTLRVTSSTPSSVDWVEKGAVTDVKNQGQCGSCWSFSTTGAVEGAYYINEGSLISLSEQQLVSCDKTDSGCDGGMMDYAFSWIKSNGGICEEADYEYTSSEGTAASCKSACTPVVTVTGYTDVTENDEDAMKAAVAKQPVSVAIEADTSAFQLYESGVFTSSSCGTDIDHGVLVVGYGTDDDTDYWKVKNSWGSSWGESGYIRLERGVNMCGIASLPSYPKGATKASTTLVADKTSLFEDAMRSIFGTTTPSGTYKGSKSVLGQSITATITIEDDSHFDFAISGAASIDCDDESFTLDGGKFNVPGATTSGDCLYEALNKNNVELSSVTYDATSDEITVNVKYEGFLTLSVVLDKQSTNTVSALASTLFSLYADTTPSGTYKGSKSVLGQSVTATIKFEDDSHFDFAISGAASIDCDDESFTLDGGKFNVPGATTSGDCLYEALNKNNVELSSVTYDATSDEITVDVKYEGFLTLSVVLDKQ